MKREDLEKLGLTEDQITGALDLHHEEITHTKEELAKAQDDLKLAQGKVTETEAKMKELEGLDKEGYEKKIKELNESLRQKDADHARELADRDFDSLVKDCITSVKGKNVKAIMALLDVDTLKASKNQKEDVAAALKALTEAEDSKMLFGDPAPNPVGTENLIGEVKKTSVTQGDTLKSAIAEHYNKQ